VCIYLRRVSPQSDSGVYSTEVIVWRYSRFYVVENNGHKGGGNGGTTKRKYNVWQ
jgi:hypothetical protein